MSVLQVTIHHQLNLKLATPILWDKSYYSLSDGSIFKLTEIVFMLTNDQNENSWNGVKFVELKSESSRRHGYIQIDYTY